MLALLDSAGRPQTGWPVELAGFNSCEQLLPIEDGTVRIICTQPDSDGDSFSRMAAFAFDSTGRMLEGWPVDLQGFGITGRVVATDLVLFAHWPRTGVIGEGQPDSEDGLVTIAADGTTTVGARGQMGTTCCGDLWVVAPDGVAYGVGWPRWPTEKSRLTSVDMSGVRPGWPVEIDGLASAPAFGGDGRIVFTAGSLVRSTTRVLMFEREGVAPVASSAELPIPTAVDGQTGGCSYEPPSPLVAADGTIFFYGEVNSEAYALDPALAVMPGWPYRSATLFVRPAPGLESEHEEGFCPPSAIPAVGPDNTLYLSLQARSATVGASIAAVRPDGNIRPGWPVELQRAGGEFWSVVEGSDGTAYALAIQPEAGNLSSATILAIGADGEMLRGTTIIDPYGD